MATPLEQYINTLQDAISHLSAAQRDVVKLRKMGGVLSEEQDRERSNLYARLNTAKFRADTHLLELLHQLKEVECQERCARCGNLITGEPFVCHGFGDDFGEFCTDYCARGAYEKAMDQRYPDEREQDER